jgi:hypothetical protein
VSATFGKKISKPLEQFGNPPRNYQKKPNKRKSLLKANKLNEMFRRIQ